MTVDAVSASGPPVTSEPKRPGLRALRHARRELRLELSSVNRWRRLVRARIEVAVAAAAPPDPLGLDILPFLGVDAQGLLPRQIDLEAALRSGLPIGELERLDSLRILDTQLGQYQDAVAAALGAATEEFIARLSLHPVDALDVPGLRSPRELA